MGVRREATQNIMTEKCFYIRSKKKIYSRSQGKVKKLYLGSVILVFAVTSWVTLNFALLDSGILSFLFCTIRQEEGVGSNMRSLREHI